MLNDHTEIESYSSKNILTDLCELYTSQNEYDIEDIIPSTRGAFGNDNKIYAITSMTKILISSSLSEEKVQETPNNSIDYLEWYDEYLDKKEIKGCGSIENILFANICEYIDEQSGVAYFESDSFKELIKEYKMVLKRHPGKVDDASVRETQGLIDVALAKGPDWSMTYTHQAILTIPGGKCRGIKTVDGEEVVLATFMFPMGILNTSKHKDSAFDFIMYYCYLGSYYYKGGIMEESYLAEAPFSAFESIIQREICETPKPFYVLPGTGFKLEDREHCFYTEDHKEQLRDMLGKLTPTTKEQNDIFEMLMEEMDGYLKDEVSLDDLCRVLQSRATIYLGERR